MCGFVKHPDQITFETPHSVWPVKMNFAHASLAQRITHNSAAVMPEMLLDWNKIGIEEVFGRKTIIYG